MPGDVIHAPDMNVPGSNLWAITCYFNPVGFRRRLMNYHLFRQRLAVPLVAVELSHNGRFELGRGDAEVLVQLQSADVMWQKERLLNIALQHVPRACQKIAWLDCDVVFENENWPELASRALDEFHLVHLFQERHDLLRDDAPDPSDPPARCAVSPSVIHKMATENMGSDSLLATPGTKRLWTTGLAWASRRDTLDAHGLYDAWVLGSGDRATLYAALGQLDCVTPMLGLNARREEHYLAWARPYHARVGGRVGCIPGRIYHLWHGELRDRQYVERARRFAEFAFDPYTDIALDGNQCWRWNSDKSAMHAFVRDYFASRKEDGE